MKRAFSFAMVFTMLATPALAQTDLTIAATGSAKLPPDEAVARLNVFAADKSAAIAQAQVNAEMTKALAAARAVPGLQVETTGYTSNQSYDYMPGGGAHMTGYTANQGLTLTLPSPGGALTPAFSTLLANLQADGVLLNELGGGMSVAGADAANQLAIHSALRTIKAQAAQVAAGLDESVSGTKAVYVNALMQPMPMVSGGPIAVAGAEGGMSSPVAAPQDMVFTASITAQMELGKAP